ncbi:MAG TPA: hypothetical protein VIP98_11255 [Microlunatus sp.]
MVTFVDRALIWLAAPATMTDLLTAGGPGPYPRLRRVLDSVYRSEAVDVAEVSSVTAGSVAPVVRYDILETISLNHTASAPAYSMAEIRGVRRCAGQSLYADLLAKLTLQITVTRDTGGIASAAFEPIEDIQSFADFQSRFSYLDVDEFLADHQITTVDELRSRYDYLRGEIHFRTPTQQDLQPTSVIVDVPLACVLSEDLDLLAALRTATALRAAIDAADSGRTDPLFGPPIHSAAIAVVFPQDALAGGAPTAAQIDLVCAGAQVLPLFASPP